MNTAAPQSLGGLHPGIIAGLFKFGEEVGHCEGEIAAEMLSLQQPLCCSPDQGSDEHICSMVDEANPAGAIRAWMLGVLRDHPELSAASWAKAAKVAGSTVQRAIKPDYPFVTSSRTLAKLAAVVNASPPEIRKTADLQVVPRFLPTRFKVQAGLWFEMDSDEPIEPYDRPVVPDPRFAEWPQWLEQVVGDSADRRVKPGAYVHVVDAIEMGYAPTTGHWVIVERRRDQGAVRERTLKQVEVLDDGAVRLWPRSTNPRWSEPVSLTDGVRNPDGIEVEIVGLMIGSYEPEIF